MRPGKDVLLGRAIRTARYRYVEWRPFGATNEKPDLELYDYVTDPQETVNVAAQQPEVVASLSAMLASHPSAKPPVERTP